MNYKEVYETIKKHLENKTPHSTVRIGDGESMILFTEKNKQPKRLNWFLRNQFAYVMERDKVLEIKQLLIDGYANADIIGVPTQVHREMHGVYWAEAENKLNQLSLPTKFIPKTSIDLHSELLVSGLLNDLVRSQKEIVCIFGRNLDEELKRKFKLDRVDSFVFTPEQRYEADRAKSNYYPEEYTEALEFIENTDCSGKLCLVGCGMLGKNLAWKLKQAGGIVLDIGHVPDLWAGKITRGKNKGALASQTEWKL